MIQTDEESHLHSYVIWKRKKLYHNRNRYLQIYVTGRQRQDTVEFDF